MSHEEKFLASQAALHAGIAAYKSGEFHAALRAWREASELGLAAADYCIGQLYEKGKGVAADLPDAVVCYRRAADGGHVDSQYRLGVIYRYGAGADSEASADGPIKSLDGSDVGRDPRAAFHWLGRAAAAGKGEAQLALGDMLSVGEGCAQDLVAAARWYAEAARQRFAAAEFALGEVCFNGRGVPENLNIARYWYGLAAEQNHPRAAVALGQMYLHGKGVAEDRVQAARLFARAAAGNDAIGLYLIGILHLKGEGVAEDIDCAVTELRRSAQLGYLLAKIALGEFYSRGDNGEPDFAEAAYWYEAAAAQGDPQSQFLTGQFYAAGDGVVRSEREAAKWFLRAAENGHSAAACSIATCYASGIGVVKDVSRAIAWFEVAAKAGVETAQVQLARLLANGGPLETEITRALRRHKEDAGVPGDKGEDRDRTSDVISFDAANRQRARRLRPLRSGSPDLEATERERPETVKLEIVSRKEPSFAVTPGVASTHSGATEQIEDSEVEGQEAGARPYGPSGLDVVLGQLEESMKRATAARISDVGSNRETEKDKAQARLSLTEGLELVVPLNESAAMDWMRRTEASESRIEEETEPSGANSELQPNTGMLRMLARLDEETAGWGSRRDLQQAGRAAWRNRPQAGLEQDRDPGKAASDAIRATTGGLKEAVARYVQARMEQRQNPAGQGAAEWAPLSPGPDPQQERDRVSASLQPEADGQPGLSVGQEWDEAGEGDQLLRFRNALEEVTEALRAEASHASDSVALMPRGSDRDHPQNETGAVRQPQWQNQREQDTQTEHPGSTSHDPDLWGEDVSLWLKCVMEPGGQVTAGRAEAGPGYSAPSMRGGEYQSTRGGEYQSTRGAEYQSARGVEHPSTRGAEYPSGMREEATPTQRLRSLGLNFGQPQGGWPEHSDAWPFGANQASQAAPAGGGGAAQRPQGSSGARDQRELHSVNFVPDRQQEFSPGKTLIQERVERDERAEIPLAPNHRSGEQRLPFSAIELEDEADVVAIRRIFQSKRPGGPKALKREREAGSKGRIGNGSIGKGNIGKGRIGPSRPARLHTVPPDPSKGVTRPPRQEQRSTGTNPHGSRPTNPVSELEWRVARFASRWKELIRSHRALSGSNDATARAKIERDMLRLAQGLEGDPQLKAMLNARAPELGVTQFQKNYARIRRSRRRNPG